MTASGFGERRRRGGVLDVHQMQQDRGVLGRVHADLDEAGADFLGDDLGQIGLADAAMAAQQVERQHVGDAGAV